MSEFRFKKFSVKNEESAMKVNTDGVLLGAAVHLDRGGIRVLDAGTGTGTIALMIAQRLEEKNFLEGSVILGIDIDVHSAKEAAENFLNSTWSSHLECRHMPLKECSGTFDLIVSNPPFYDHTLPNPDSRKNMTRHTVSPELEGGADSALSYRTLLEFSATGLSDGGTLAMILPADNEIPLRRLAASFGLALERIMRIRTTPKKEPSRIIVHLKKNPSTGIVPTEETLTVQDGGNYTPGYRNLVKDFYLWG